MSPSKSAEEVKAAWVPNVPEDAKQLGTPPEETGEAKAKEADTNNNGNVDSFELPERTDGAKKLIKEHQISDEDVLKIKASGKEGKLTQADVEEFLAAKDAEPECAMALIFSCSGWCEKLKRSYRQGVYHPKTKEEFEALKRHGKVFKG